MSLQGIKRRFGIIGISPLLNRGISTAMKVAATDLTVLITGESGTGKEVFSKIIHHTSKRKHETMIAINCGAIPPGTINSELFGHEKGAFTGASADRKGYFQTANKGTIFLDEIAELPLDTQSYLLRILENGEFVKVGSSVVQKTDVRIIAATNVDLMDRVADGRFREDLFYRLNIVPIKVPSLKERREDIALLFRKFASDFADQYSTSPVRLDEEAQELVLRYNWPGNIRELKNAAEQLSILSEEKIITAQNLIDIIPNISLKNFPKKQSKRSDFEGFEEREILYKLLFDMKKDMGELKSLVFELIQRNNLKMPNMEGLKLLKSPDSNVFSKHNEVSDAPIPSNNNINEIQVHHPVLIHNENNLEYSPTQHVDEILSLEDMEKDLISKALIKYKGRRKDASKELGISERTLYRKIKQYELSF